MQLSNPAFYACLLSALAAGPLCVIASGASTAEVRKETKARKSFAIAAADGATAVEVFADQAGIPIIYLVQHVRGVKTNAVKGEFTPREALDRLVANTGLVVAEDAKTGALMINRAVPRKEPSVPPQSNPKTQATEEPAKPMKRKNALAMFGAWLAVAFAPADAQTTAAQVSQPQKKEETIVLSPFIVEDATDTGYQATNTLDGSRLNTALRDIPAPISIFTREFLDDIGATDIRSVLAYDLNAEYVDDNSDNRGTGQGNGSGTLENGAEWRTRGLRGSVAVNGFRTFGNNSDTYNIERIGSNRGPNAILFGNGAAGGVLNFRTKTANVARNSNTIEYRFGSFDTARGTIDVNRVLMKDKLALRATGLLSHEEKELPHLYTDKKAVTLAGQYRLSEETRLNVSFERNISSGVGGNAWGAVLDQVSKFQDALNGGAVVWDPVDERYEVASTRAAVGTESGVGNTSPRTVLVYGPAGPNETPALWEGTSSTANRVTRITNAPRYPGETFTVPDEGIIPYNRVSGGGAATYGITALSNLTATLNHRWFDKLYMELTYNRSRWNGDTALGGGSTYLRADINYRLSDGTLNPYFYGNGYYFMGPDQSFRHVRERDDDTYRAAFSNDLDLGKRWGLHRLAVMGERHRQREMQFRAREQWAGAPYGGFPEANQNHVYRRRYFKIDGPYENYTIGYGPDPYYSTETHQSRFSNIGTLATRWTPPNAGQVYDNENTTDSTLFVMQNYLFNHRLVTTLGLRADRIDSEVPNAVRDPMTSIWRVARPGDAGYALAESSEKGNRRSLGAVFHLNSHLSLTANTSTGVDASNTTSRRVLPDDLPPEPFKARSEDYGIAFSLFENKISGSVRYFETRSEKEDTNSRVQAVFTQPHRDVLKSFQTYFAQAGITTFGSGDPIQSLDDLQQTPLLSGANGYLSDNVSSGYEFELIANPTRNWTVRFGYSHSERSRTNVLTEGEPWWAERVALYDQLDSLYRSRTGDTSVLTKPFINQNDTEGNFTVAERIADSAEELAAVRAVEEKGYGNRPDKFNLWTRYTFANGRLKGLAVAGGMRFQEKNIAGYDVPTDTLLYGDDTFLADLMLQYKTKGLFKWLPDRMGVTYQLNLYNLLNNRDIVISSLRLRPGESTGVSGGAVGAIGGAGVDEPYIRRGWRQTPRTAYLTVRLDF